MHFKVADVTEKTVRKVCNTNERDGTDVKGLVKGLKYYGLSFKIWESKSPQVFKARVSKSLKSNKALIINSDAMWHWIGAVEYNNRRVRVVDSMFKPMSIDQWITLKQLSDMCFCYDRLRDTKCFFVIECWVTNL